MKRPLNFPVGVFLRHKVIQACCVLALLPGAFVGLAIAGGNEGSEFLHSSSQLRNAALDELSNTVSPTTPCLANSDEHGREGSTEPGAGHQPLSMESDRPRTSVGAKSADDGANYCEDAGDCFWRHVLGGLIGLLIGGPLSIAMVRWLMRRDGLLP